MVSAIPKKTAWLWDTSVHMGNPLKNKTMWRSTFYGAMNETVMSGDARRGCKDKRPGEHKKKRTKSTKSSHHSREDGKGKRKITVGAQSETKTKEAWLAMCAQFLWKRFAAPASKPWWGDGHCNYGCTGMLSRLPNFSLAAVLGRFLRQLYSCCLVTRNKIRSQHSAV